MSCKIYYFSGTGNSLHVARKLKDSISHSELLPIVGLLSEEQIEIKADSIGIVFPLQGPNFPNVVKLFIQKADLSNVEYIFAIATRGGTTSAIHREMDKLLRKKGKKLQAHFHVNVFNNDPKLLNTHGREYEFHVPTEKEILEKEKEIDKKVREISRVVANREISHKKDNDYGYKYNFFLEKLILLATHLAESKSIKDYFYTDDRCTGCGICSKVCLSNRINLADGRPFWEDEVLCYMCYACLNYCPRSLVQINSKWYMKSYTTVQGRYPHPYAGIKEIISQKEPFKK